MRLIVEKFNDNDSVRYFLVTIVGYDKDEKNVAPFSYMGSRKNFEGYMVISSVEGEPLWAYYYKDGTRRYAHLHGSVKEKGESDYMGFSLYSQGIATKSGSYSTGEGDEWCYSCHQYVNFNSGVCSNCGADPLEIGGGDEYYFCPQCGLIIQNCTCPNLPSLCPVCGGYPCTCPVACPYCGDPYCNGECQNNPNPDPGNGEGDNGGGNDDGNNPSTETKPPVNILNTTDWRIQAPGKCKDACDSYLRRKGLSDVGSRSNVYRLTYQNASGVHSSTHSLSTVVSVIDRHLDAGKGITVGLSYREPSSNSDGTDHFVVITGRGYDLSNGQYYYTYMDPGRSDSFRGCDTETNRLYVDNSTNTIHYDRPGDKQGRENTVTHIRPNDGNYSGSTTY
jgi:hypothetical protein